MTNVNVPLDAAFSLSTDPADDPIIDPNYYASVTDHVILRAALQRNMSAFETEAGHNIVEAEVPPPGYPQLSSRSTDEEIDAGVRRAAGSFYHAAGTAAMGKVVDNECRVFGVEGLRVVDASVLPTPLSGHYMVPVYALAEQIAEIIAKKA
ncbi:MAG: hypothetical protein MMC23_007496 [Stictis urceolatum]|nr:hypothetical protein [Stictis urceolata]